MFEKLLQKLLKDVVGQFIDGIDTKKLNIGIWSGTVQIVNVSLKPRLLAILGIPYRITYSNISRLFITIPWKNLFTAPLVIQIESIQVLAENSAYQLTREEQGKIILLKIKQFIQKMGRELVANKKANEQKSGGYFETVYLKMLDNLYLTIRNIHFRFEVSRPLRLEPDATPFSFGVTLQSIELFAVDEKGSRVFIDRTKLTGDKNIIYKKLKLENFGFYWNHEQKQAMFLSLQTQFPVKPNQERYLKDTLDYKQIIGGKMSKQKLNYVILINAEGLIKQDNRIKATSKITKYEVSFNIKQIKMVVNEKIIKQAVWLTKETSEYLKNSKAAVATGMLDKWDGPKNQNFLGLLRKYCINQFWETDTNGKVNTPLSSGEEKMLLDCLLENKANIQIIQNKVKEIIVGDIGNKNAIMKSEIINNWQSLESLMSQQKKIEEGQLELKFNFEMDQLCLFYLDEIKTPIAQIFVKGFKISAQQDQEKGLLLQIQISRLEGLGYDQNPIIRMEHQIESTFHSPKVMKFSKLFSLTYKYKVDVGQQLDIALGGIGFFYDFKTFRELYRLPESLISNHPSQSPISPPSITVDKRASMSRPVLDRRSSRKQQPQSLNKVATKQEKALQSQVTITVENISVYILQYTKQTWRLSLSGCQLTNNSSLVPQNILVNAMSVSVSDFYVCEPFGAKIVLNLREEVPDISVLIEPIKVKVNSQILKYAFKIPSCLQTYKKNDAISLSSKYGQLFLLEEKEVWKKYDGVIIDGHLYLYEKNDEYSKYQFKVVDAIKKIANKRQVIEISVKQDHTKQLATFMLIVRNQAQLEEWSKNLLDLSESNRKIFSKPPIVESESMDKTEQNQQETQKKGYNLCVMFQQLSLLALESEKDESPIIGLVVKKTIIQLIRTKINEDYQPPGLTKKLSRKQKLSQSEQQFKSFKQLRFNSKFSKNNKEEKEPSIDEKATQGQNFAPEGNVEEVKNWQIEIKDIEYWYKNNRRLYFMEEKQDKKISAQQKTSTSVIIKILNRRNEKKVEVTIADRVFLHYQPYEILQSISYLNNRIVTIFSSVAKQKKANNTSRNSEIKEQVVKPKVQVPTVLLIDLQMKKGCEINLFNMLNYKASENSRDQVMRVTLCNLGVFISPDTKTIQIDGIRGEWLDLLGKNHALVSNFATDNKLVVSILNSKVVVKVYELYLPNYQHYLIMRAIDYLLVQLKQIILYPFNFNQYFDAFSDSDNRNSIHTRMYRCREYLQSKMTQSQIWERIKNLFQIQVSIYGGYVGVCGAGYLTVGQIRVTNAVVESYNGSIKGNVLCDQYLIQFKNLNIWLITAKSAQSNDDPNYKQQIIRKLSLKRENLKDPSTPPKQEEESQERFFTVLDRFSKQLGVKQWSERAKSKLVQLIDSQWPLDMSLVITMFGKYPEYKTIFENFETSTINTRMPIKLVLSEIHLNILATEIQGISNFVNKVVENIFFTDHMNYYYSYDEQVMKAIYKRELEKMNKDQINYKPTYDANNVILISIPVHSVLKQDQYIYCPIEFSLGFRYADINILITQSTNQQSEMPEILNQGGLGTVIQNFEVIFTQFPLSQTKISMGGLDLTYNTGDNKIKILQLTSAEQRQSRDTMFIDHLSNKKQNMPSADLSKSYNPQAFYSNQKSDKQKKQDKKNNEEQRIIGLANLLVNNQKQIKQAFSVKLFKKVKRISTNFVDDKRNEQVNIVNTEAQVIDAIELNFHNIFLNYDNKSFDFLFKISKYFKRKEKPENSSENRSQPPQNKKSEMMCRIHSFLLKIPMISSSSEPTWMQSRPCSSNQTMCILIKMAVLTQLPLFLPLRVDVDYFEAYIQQVCEDDPIENIGIKVVEKILINVKENRRSGKVKNKRKTLLQPTKIFYRRKISEQAVKVKIEKPKDEIPQNMMSSKIKSILNISPSQSHLNCQYNKNIEHYQKIKINALLTQIQIDKCFVKVSVQDLQQLSELSKDLMTRVSCWIGPKTFGGKQKEAINSSRSLPDSQSKQIGTENEIKKVTKIAFKPLEVVIMNDINFSITPLIYVKVTIADYEHGQFNVELAVNYFNLRINSWEPLIQNNVLLVKLEPYLSVEKLKASQDRLSKQISAKSNMNKESTNEYININISTNFLESLVPAIQRKKNVVSAMRLSQKSAGDQVNCWMLINQLGYDISCESKSFRGNKMSTIISIPNNKSRKLNFLSDIFQGQGFQQVLNEGTNEQLFSEGENKKNKWTISITINNQFRIKEIDIGQIGVKKYCFNYEGHPFWIYGHTYVDISKNVKYIKFYSQVMIVNSTNLDLWVKLPAIEEKNEIKNNDSIYKNDTKLGSHKLSPFVGQISGSKKDDKIKKQRRYSHDYRVNEDTKIVSSQYLQVKARDIKNKSEYIGSDELDDESIKQRLETSFRKAHSNRQNVIKIASNKEVSLAFDLDQNFKKLNQSQFADLISRQPVQQMEGDEDKNKESNKEKVESYQKFRIQKQRKKMRTIYKIMPVGKIINKLPEQINVALKLDEHILYAYSLAQDESQFLYTSFSQLEISVHAKGFQWSVFTPCNVVQMIGLEDFNYNKLNIKVSLFTDDDGVDTVILYPIAVLYNDTDYDLHVRDPESKNHSYSKVLPKKSISLSNYRILVLKPQLPQSASITTQSNYTKVYMNQDEITCKFELNPIKCQVKQRKVDHSPPMAVEAMLINQVSLRTSGATGTNMRINTKFVTVSHKYYFSNKTNHTILIRKYHADSANRLNTGNFSLRSYEPNSTQSFWLFEEDLGAKDNLSYYELTIKNSQFEWSGALSITKPGNNHFLLRNRSNFNEVHFMNLVVIKYHQMSKFKIELKDGDNQIPFLIVNSWSGFIIKLPEFGNLVLREGDRVDFSWDHPVLKKGTIPILVGPAQEVELDKSAFSRYQIKTQNPDQNQLIKLKKSFQAGEISFSQKVNKIIQIREYQRQERKTEKLSCEIELPIRIAVINNSFMPATHLCDFSSKVCVKASTMGDSTIVRMNLDSIQVDNQTRYRVYFPVVLSTSMAITLTLAQAVQLDVQVKPLNLNIEEDFAKDIYATAMLVAALFSDKKGIQSQLNRMDNESELANNILISKLSLPAVLINLQVKTKKLSIQTTINLEKPASTKYPWQSFPYPIKNIAIALLSHLSISPWALISSFQKGVVSLLTEQESSKGIEGFFGQILAALSNSVNGFVGILVGHDIERVNNFFDGLQQGSNLLVQQIAEIKDCFQPQECTISSIITSFGYGLISIVMKPIKGVLQMTLKVSEGIKKTALFSFEDSLNTFKQRDAIVFYGQEQKFRTYQANQSYLMVLLLKICGEPLKYFHLLRFFSINNKQTNNMDIVCIGTEQVILINTKTQKLIWQVNLHEVSKIYNSSSSCIKFSPFNYELDAVYQDLADEILMLLLKIHKKVFIKS